MESASGEAMSDAGDTSYFGEGSSTNGNPKAKRRRLRAAVSCTNCQSRKIKCNRELPCSSCVSRGMVDTCQWEDLDAKRAVVTSTNRGWETALEALRQEFEARIQQIEGRLASTSFAPAAGPSPNVKPVPPLPSGQSSIKPSSNDLTPVERKEEEAEDAALALEALASGHTPNDLPDSNQPGGPSSKEAFAYASILDRTHASPYPLSNKIPWSASLTPRHIADVFLNVIGGRKEADVLLTSYDSNLGWAHGSIHSLSFKREYEAFWAVVPTLDRNFLDPAWLALLAAVLGVAARCDPECHKDALADELAEVAKMALNVANWLKVPQFRVVQTCLLLSMQDVPGHRHSSSFTFQAMALKTAQNMGFHRLGSDPSILPAPDKSVPTGSLLHRELAIRIWWELTGYDWSVGQPASNVYTIMPSSFNTCTPSNYDDTDLDDGPPTKPERSPAETTKGTILKAKAQTAEFFRKLADLGPPPASNALDMDLYYATLLVLDKEFKTRLEHISVIEPIKSDVAHDIVFAVLFNARRLMLHRLLGKRGYQDKRFATSTRICTESAQRILEGLHLIPQARAPHIIARFIHKHIMSAVLAVFTDAFHDIDFGVAEAITEAKLVNVPVAIAVFKQSEESGLKASAELGAKGRLLATALLDYLGERRRLYNQGLPCEEYTQALRRIAKQINRQINSTSTSLTRASTPISASSGSQINSFMGDDGTQQLLASLGLLPQATEPFAQMQAPYEMLRGPDADLTMWSFSSMDGMPSTWAGNSFAANGSGERW